MTSSSVSSFNLEGQSDECFMLSSQHLNWKGILVEYYQRPTTPDPVEVELPALTNHWLNLPLGQPTQLIHKCDNRLHESTFQKGDSMFVPAGQPSYWCWEGNDSKQPAILIHLKPELIAQIASAPELLRGQIELVNCFSKQDLTLQNIGMLLYNELHSGGIMGQLYVESLTQVLVIHLLRHYSKSTEIITSRNRSLTDAQLKQVIDYIDAYLDQDLSLSQIAAVINISPTYFASLFKQAKGIPPHQYVIQQRIERAKWLLLQTDLTFAQIALKVGFSSQSHLTRQFKRHTGMTPKQFRFL